MGQVVWGLLGIVSANVAANAVSSAATLAIGPWGGLSIPGGGASNLFGRKWSIAEYAGAGLWLWIGPKLLRKATKPAHLSAFKAGQALAIGGKILGTEILTRLPSFPGKSALGATTYGYTADGQGWARQGDDWVAMQGLGSSIVQGNAYDNVYDGMGELVEGSPYDNVYNFTPPTAAPQEDLAMAGGFAGL